MPPYDESTYLNALRKRDSPLLREVTTPAQRGLPNDTGCEATIDGNDTVYSSSTARVVT